MKKCKICNCKTQEYMFIECKCGMKTCMKCRNTHPCSYTYFNAHQNELKKENQKIEFEKMEYI